MFGGFNKRFVKLFEGRYLCYFDPNSMAQPKGNIDLATVRSVQELPEEKYVYVMIHARTLIDSL